MKKKLQEISNFSSHKNIQLHALLSIKKKTILVEFILEGDIEEYILPSLKKAKRVDELWKESCFELFLANQGENAYYEFNVSPSSSWNFYHLNSYRKNILEFKNISPPLVQTRREKKSFKISSRFSLPSQLNREELTFHVTAILLNKERKRSFWSPCQKMKKPDFHQRNCFEKFIIKKEPYES